MVWVRISVKQVRHVKCVSIILTLVSLKLFVYLLYLHVVCLAEFNNYRTIKVTIILQIYCVLIVQNCWQCNMVRVCISLKQVRHVKCVATQPVVIVLQIIILTHPVPTICVLWVMRGHVYIYVNVTCYVNDYYWYCDYIIVWRKIIILCQ